MSLEFCVLGSGSSGNSTVVRTPQGVMLIDCGFGPRATARRLSQAGLHNAVVRAICLTHLDHDHFNPNWVATIVKQQITVWCHESRAEELLCTCATRGGRDEIEPLVRTFDDDGFEPLKKLEARAIPFAHDSDGSHGFVLHSRGHTAGYATDLGHVPDDLVERFAGLDLIALESNYDVAMEQGSDRPWFLKRRIMGGKGHLSNDQAFDCLTRIFNHAEKSRKRLPEHVVLLHRSRQCNCPVLLRNLFCTDARVAPRLVLTEQHEPTAWLRFNRPPALCGKQMNLAWA